MGTRTSYEPGVFSWVDLATTDVDGAKAFYGGLFGWSYDDQPIPEGGSYAMCRLDGSDVAGLGSMPAAQREMDIPPHWNNYVTVASADEAARRAEELGGQVLAPAFDVMDVGRMAVIADPTGAPLSVWQPRTHPGAGLVNEPGAFTWNELSTHDVDAAKSFLEPLFGWRVEEIDTQGGPRYWTIGHDSAAAGRNGGVRELAPEQREAGVPPHWMPYFVVESADDASRHAGELGGSTPFGPIDLPMGARIAVLTDPQGAWFAIFEGETDG
jgi:uncharacterized protein